MPRWAVVATGAAGLGAVLLLGAILWVKPVDGEPFETPAADPGDLARVAEHRVYFAHKSVGYNIVDAIPSVYQEGGVAAPEIVESREAPTDPAFVHAANGENGDPLGKIELFDQTMRAGMAERVDVAVLKLCYVDFRKGKVDVDGVFAAYRSTFAALSRDFPDTAFVAATAPVTTERGPMGKVRAAVGRPDTLGPEHNVVRERFNALMREEFTEPGTLFDIAAVQSTPAEGGRVAYEREGERYYAMAPAYASDPGHLNATGGRVAASALLWVVARALD